MTKYWLWLTTRKHIGPAAIAKLLRQFPSPEAIYAADDAAFEQVEGLTKQEREGLQDRSMDDVEKILSDCYEKDISILTLQDAQYPTRLKNIDDPPAVLYFRGRLPDFDTEPVIAVVGTRKATPYGLYMAKRMGYQLGRDGAVVISGLAAGVDSYAIEGALTAGNAVVGVLGCGVDVVYPKWNGRLFEDVLARGCLISEYPPGTPPYSSNFPVRNRILSGLALGVLVVEAPPKSGALITAARALEQGRDVFAIPGNVDSQQSVGCNRLVQQGAMLVGQSWDILQEYQPLFPEKIKQNTGGGEKLPMPNIATNFQEKPARKVAEAVAVPKAKPTQEEKIDVDNGENGAYIDLQELKNTRSKDQMAIITELMTGPVHADDLVERTQLATHCVSAALSLLEVDGLVERLPGRRYRLTVHVKED
jgi:DNA processing protein